MRKSTESVWLSLLVVPTLMLLGCPDDDKDLTAADGGSSEADAGDDGKANPIGNNIFAKDGPLPPDSEEKCDDLKSGFPGDELCLKPPKAGTGIQMHAGPKSYSDEDVKPFLIMPGEEVTECYFLKSPNEDNEFYFPRKIHMRPGSHHLISYIINGDMPDGFGSCDMSDRAGSFGGAETTIVNYPTNNIEAPENKGLGKVLPRNSQIKLEWHHINTTNKPILREAWINIYFKPRAEITKYVQDMFMIGIGINVPPHEKHIVHNSCTIMGDTRIVDIFGHFHAHTTRFSAWRTREGKKDLFYEVFDWHETPTIAYDTLTNNEKPDRELLRPGGTSGPLEIKKGDTIEWECEIDNTTDGTLRIGNFVQTAEMCNLFGTYESNSAALLMCRGNPKVTNLTHE